MDVRVLNENDYDNILEGWWKDWRWHPPTKKMLPENGTGGVMVSSGGVDVCAGFLYFTNSNMAWIEFIVSNIKYKEPDRGDCLEFLINVLCSIAKDKGFSYIYTSLKNENLINRYLMCGFEIGSSNCKEMFKVI